MPTNEANAAFLGWPTRVLKNLCMLTWKVLWPVHLALPSLALCMPDAGGHVNFSNKATRVAPTGWQAIQEQCEKLGKRHAVRQRALLCAVLPSCVLAH